MSSVSIVPPSTLSLLCDTAGRALRCTVLADLDGGRALIAEPAAFSLPFGPEPSGAALHFIRVASGDGAPPAPFTDGDRALAVPFAILAGRLHSSSDEARHDARRLAALERHVDEIQSLASIGSFEWHVLEDRIDWSAEQLRMHGLDSAGRPKSMEDFLACVHPDDRERVAALTERMLQDGHGDAVYRIVRPDGETRDVHARSRVILGDDGRPRRVIGTTQDVTHQRSIERALEAQREASEAHFRQLIENSSDLLMISNDRMQLTYVSPSAERILGYTPTEMLARTPEEMVHPEDVPGLLAAMGEILATPGTIRRMAWRIRHRDGRWRTIDAIGRTLDPDSTAPGVVCNGRDITEQREAELALQHSEEHFRRLIENGSDLLMISDPRGPLRYVSPSVERLLGFTPDEMLEKTPADALHPDDVPMVMESMRAIAEDPGSVHSVTWRIRHRDGSWRVMEALARTFHADSADAGIVVNGRDVTERRAAEEELRHAKADAEAARVDAERANRAKSDFLSRMSHELRTPMNSILGFAQVLEDVDLAPEYRTGVAHILKAGRHLLGLINEVLDIARIEADQQPLSLEAVRVDAVIREAMDMVRPIAGSRGIWVGETASPAAGRYVRADRQRLTQVLLNLLSNAVKYNRTDGTVRIGASLVAGNDGRDRIRIRVADEGTGIAPERQGQLFVPFARLGAEHTGVEGTGLGLALSQRLAGAMGGTLFLERSDATGTVFCVDLDVDVDPLAAVHAVTARNGDAGAAYPPATLLYIEDNLANLALVETVLLPRPEWRLVPALQGRLGLELALEHAPDLVLLDLHLPDIPGRELLRRLRADPRTAAVPVVVVSADATPRTVEALLAEGADAFLTKPLDVRAFLATVERLLARGAQAP